MRSNPRTVAEQATIVTVRRWCGSDGQRPAARRRRSSPRRSRPGGRGPPRRRRRRPGRSAARRRARGRAARSISPSSRISQRSAPWTTAHPKGGSSSRACPLLTAATVDPASGPVRFFDTQGCKPTGGRGGAGAAAALADGLARARQTLVRMRQGTRRRSRLSPGLAIGAQRGERLVQCSTTRPTSARVLPGPTTAGCSRRSTAAIWATWGARSRRPRRSGASPSARSPTARSSSIPSRA